MLRSFDRGRVRWRFRMVVQFADTLLCKRKSSRNDCMTPSATGHALSARRGLTRYSQSSSHLLLFLAETPYDFCPLYLFMVPSLDKKMSSSFLHVYALLFPYFLACKHKA